MGPRSWHQTIMENLTSDHSSPLVFTCITFVSLGTLSTEQLAPQPPCVRRVTSTCVLPRLPCPGGRVHVLLIACWRRWMQASSPARATTTAPWTRSSCACLGRQMPTWMGTIVVKVTAATARLASGGLLVRRAASHEPPRALRQHRRRAQGAGATKIGQLSGAARGVRRVFLSYHALHHQHAQCARHACAVWPARAWPASPPTRSRRAARAPTLTRPLCVCGTRLSFSAHIIKGS